MLDYQIAFDRPEYLGLLALIPVLWWLGRQSMAGLATGRRYAAWGLRSLLVVLITCALAEVQLVRTSDRVAVLYLVDRSASVPAGKTGEVLDYIRRSSAQHADRQREDRAGVITFGRDAAVETPPLPGQVHLPNRFESDVDAGATNLAAALRLAQAVFPADAAKRVVIISDGNENQGNALAQALQLAAAGIGIDVWPIERDGQREVSVEKVSLPADLRQGTPFEVRVVLNHNTGTADSAPARGRLRINRTAGGQTQTLAEKDVELAPGKHVLAFQEEIAAPDFYTYSARFVPDDAQQDSRVENNEATAFTHVRGRGQVLLIEDFARPGRFLELVEMLRRQELEVTVQPTNQLFSDLAELQRFDLVILADVARTTGDGADELVTFSDEQIEMLAHNTQHMGSGLLVLGGPDSFGAGGWTNTALERAMPVDFQVKNAKVVPSGALVLVIDRSGSMSGDKLELSKAAAIAAVKVLGHDDQVGVVAFDSAARWIVPLTQVGDPQRIYRQIARLQPGGGTDMEPGMAQGYNALRRADAAVKHMIVLTDGQTHGSNFHYMTRLARDQKITTSTVAVGNDSAATLLNEIARIGGGKSYLVDNPRTIPRIFMKEAMRVARPVIFEDPQGITPQHVASHEMLAGIDGALPPLTGFVMTSPKNSALVEIPLVSPRPSGNQNSLLASWQYGLGRAVAFTTDAGQRWTKQWPEWSGFEPLFTQMARWTMRPTDNQGSFDVFTDVQDGTIQVVVTALDKDDQFVNFLDLGGTLIDPHMKPIDVKLEQTAPGRYVARVPAEQTGSYFLSLAAGPNQAPLRAGVNVPYSAEYADRQSNPQKLRALAELTPAGGQPGVVLNADAETLTDTPNLATNVFRPDLQRAATRQASWHLLALAAGCLFFFDVLNRRVILSMAWAPRAARWATARWRRNTAPASDSPALERLQARKQEIDRQLEDRRAAARFEPAAEASEAELPLEAGATATATQVGVRQPTRPQLEPEKEAEGYTARLLKAKQGAIRPRPGTSDDAP